MEATDAKALLASRKSGAFTRKLASAMKALSDFDVLSDWIRQQVVKDAQSNGGVDPAEIEAEYEL